jgi:two-component system, LuxR family, response regulator FixJ
LAANIAPGATWRRRVTQASDQRIFLIDEDEVVRDSLKVLLESHGIQVEDFGDATELLSQKRVAPNGCLVLGYNRLIIDGLELITTLRRRGITLPVIFIVGGGVASTKAAALAAGAFAYLERPIEETALIRAIKAAFLRPNGSKYSNGDAPPSMAPVSARP